MIYSKTAQYSLQALLFIAANHQDGKNLLVRDIARELKLPASFLSKILQTLSRFGFLSSVKGPKGGFAISEKGANSTVADVIAIVDGPMDFESCLSGFSPCSDENACPFHNTWKRIRSEIKDLVSTRPIMELSIELPDVYKVLSMKGVSVTKN